ncbi:MAG TPA: hypothetical protein PLV45_09290 [bacterium]|nr:hypothetical protein [bacterium]
MDRLKTFLPTVFCVMLACLILSDSVHAEKVSRKSIDVFYEHDQLADGFGNIRTVHVSGYLRNRERRIASSVTVVFSLKWKNRPQDERKVEFKNVPQNDIQTFEFDVDLGTNPDVLLDLLCHIEQIKFSKEREPSQLTEHHLVIHDYYSLARLNEEGKDFLSIIKFIHEKNPFRTPSKGEFEKTNEYESRLNEAENEHFARLMDELEQRYGQLLGGHNAVVRFLPRTFRKAIIYLSECSAYFQVPIHLGRYNADLQRFENINMIPRTFPFTPETVLPGSDIHLLHKTGVFFLRMDSFEISREEARRLREEDKYLILELTVRMGVVQDGPYLDDMCVVEKIQLKNNQTGRVIREWSINP